MKHVVPAIALSLSALGSYAPPPAAAQATAPARTAVLQGAPAELAALVPTDAFAYVQFASLAELERAFATVREAIGPEAVGLMLLMTNALDVDESQVVRDKPLGIAFSFFGSSFGPMPTVVVPVVDAQAFLAAQGGGAGQRKSAISPGYVALSRLPSYEKPTAACKLCTGLSQGSVVARIDLEKVLEITRPLIDMALQQFEQTVDEMQELGGPAGDILQAELDAAYAVLDSVQGLDLALSLAGTRADLSGALTVAADSDMARLASDKKVDLARLAPLLDPDAGMSLLLAMDMPALMRLCQGFIDKSLEMYPEATRNALSKMFDALPAIAALFGDCLAENIDFDPAGMRLAGYFEPTDAAALLARYKEMLSSLVTEGAGFEIEAPTERTVSGLVLTEWRMKFDVDVLARAQDGSLDPAAAEAVSKAIEGLYGRDGLHFALASSGKRAVMVMGGDEAYLERSLARLGSATPTTSAAAALPPALSGCNPAFALHVNVGRLMAGVSNMLSAADGPFPPAIPAELTNMPLRVGMYGGVAGRVWRGGLSADVKEVADFAKRAETSFGRGKRTSERGHVAKIRSDIVTIESAVESYMLENGGRYPDSLELLVQPDQDGHAYLKGDKVPTDPWKNEYGYEPPRGARKMRIYTLGRDGLPGGAGDNRDIDNLMIHNGDV